MPLTPADIHNVIFRKSHLGRRGYDQEQVDVLLDAVTGEMIELLEANDALRQRARRSDAAAVATQPSDSAANELAALVDQLDEARRAHNRAQQAVQVLRTGLDDARRRTAGEAPADASRVLALARRTADTHLRSAQQDAHEVLRDARVQSQRIIEAARSTACDIGDDSGRRVNAAAAQRGERHTALVQQVKELADFAGNYRAALDAHIRRQVR
jgi:DivIVA domain-containing protein